MRHSLLVLITVLVLCTFVSGCVFVPNTTGSTTLPPDSHITSIPPLETEPQNVPKINMQYLPELVENPENFPVLKWVCLTELMLGGGLRTWSEDAAIELNQMLAEKNMPFRVQFILMTSNQYYGEWEWMEQDGIPELLAEADLIYGYLTSSEMQELLLPITEHVTGDAQPSLQNAVPHEYYWQRGMVGDDIYGIPMSITGREVWLGMTYTASRPQRLLCPLQTDGMQTRRSFLISN